MDALYDKIGRGYCATRAADPRIRDRLVELLALPVGAQVLDVGAGTGNYSEALAVYGYEVTALEPSAVMRGQGRVHERLTWKAGVAEELPFDDGEFDGVVMTLCMHHFSDWQRALREAVRVAGDGPVVIFSFDAELDSGFWLFDYFPSFLEKDVQWFPKVAELETCAVGELERSFELNRFALPSDLKDHFAAAGWARPEIYLDAAYRSGISSFSSVDAESVESGLSRLEADLQSGEWDKRYGALREASSLDVGYVLLKVGAEAFRVTAIGSPAE